ncbi:hypothetical protein lbkm_0125 [Lachnospiraceae bacterium KM106-2]|nr:hypothetical protein lbkm_0125 [Lachnospiraceae bacterium KM106-2]
MKRIRGSITIFLTIILLPIIFIVGMIVDSANISLSKSVVESAGELTLNSGLANYDFVLKDVYGLFAMSQNYESEEARTKDLEDYFNHSLSASNYIDANNDASKKSFNSDLLNDLADIFNPEKEITTSKNFVDVTASNFSVKVNTDSSLANPGVLKNQIVEFMKYRGPAEVGLKLIDSLACFKKVKNQTDVTKQQLKVNDQLSEVNKSYANLYYVIRKYDSLVKTYKAKEKDYAAVVKDSSKPYMKSLKKAVKVMLMYKNYKIDTKVDKLSGKKPLFTTSLDNRVYDTGSQTDSYDFTNKTWETVWGDLKSTMNDLVDNIDSKSDNGVLKKLKDKSGVLDTNKVDTGDEIIKVVKFTKEYNDCLKKINLVIQLRKYLYKQIPDNIEDLSESYLDHHEEISRKKDCYEYMRDKVDRYLGWAEDDSKTIQNKYSTFHNNYKKIDADSAIEGYLKDAVKETKDAYKELEEIVTKSHQVNSADDSSIGNDKIYKLCDKAIKDAKDTLEKANQENEKLNHDIDSYNSAMETSGDDDYSSKMREEYKQNKEIFSEKKLNKITEQLDAGKLYLYQDKNSKNAKKTYKDIKVLTCQVATKEYTDIRKETEKRVKNKAKEKCSSSSLEEKIKDEDQLDSFVTELLKDEVTIPTDTVIDNANDGYYLKQISEVIHEKNKEIGVPDFYIYLMTQFSTKKKELGDKEPSKDQVENSTKKLKEEAKKTTSNDEIADGSGSSKKVSYSSDLLNDVPSDRNPDTFNVIEWGEGSQFEDSANIIGQILSCLEHGLESMRDNLLVCEYVLDNFSYATGSKEIALQAGSSDKADYIKKHYATMTNVPITSNNNKLYGCEVEYVVFGKKGSGGKGPETNVSTTKRYIYAIRFAMNTIYALTNKEISAETLPPAVAIQAATFGIVPYKVAQVTIELGLAAGESALDLKELMDGKSVPLYKSQNTWRFSISGALNYLKTEAAEDIAGVVKNKISEGVETLNKCISDAADWTTEQINGAKTKVQEGIVDTLAASVDDCADNMADIVSKGLDTAYTELYTNPKADIKAQLNEMSSGIRTQLSDYIKKATNNGEVSSFLTDEVMEPLMNDVVDKVLTDMGSKYQKCLEDTKNNIELDANTYRDYIKDVNDKIHTKLTGLTTKVADKCNTWIGKEAEAISKDVKFQGNKLAAGVSEKVKGEVQTLVDRYVPSTSTSITTGKKAVSGKSSLGSLIEFNYKDYLRLFLFMRLCTGQGSTVERIGDVIQVNCRNALKDYAQTIGASGELAHPKGDAFRMKNAYTYLSIGARISTRLLLLNQPQVTKEYSYGNSLNFDRWSYDYSSFAGY